MLNHLNKRFGNTFSHRELFSIKPKEQGLKKLPSLHKAMRAEYAEHNSSMGSPVVKGSAVNRNRARQLYKGKQ